MARLRFGLNTKSEDISLCIGRAQFNFNSVDWNGRRTLDASEDIVFRTSKHGTETTRNVIIDDCIMTPPPFFFRDTSLKAHDVKMGIPMAVWNAIAREASRTGMTCSECLPADKVVSSGQDYHWFTLRLRNATDPFAPFTKESCMKKENGIAVAINQEDVIKVTWGATAGSITPLACQMRGKLQLVNTQQVFDLSADPFCRYPNSRVTSWSLGFSPLEVYITDCMDHVAGMATSPKAKVPAGLSAAADAAGGGEKGKEEGATTRRTIDDVDLSMLFTDMKMTTNTLSSPVTPRNVAAAASAETAAPAAEVEPKKEGLSEGRAAQGGPINSAGEGDEDRASVAETSQPAWLGTLLAEIREVKESMLVEIRDLKETISSMRVTQDELKSQVQSLVGSSTQGTPTKTQKLPEASSLVYANLRFPVGSAVTLQSSS